jgi:hypothetical protein
MHHSEAILRWSWKKTKKKRKRKKDPVFPFFVFHGRVGRGNVFILDHEFGSSDKALLEGTLKRRSDMQQQIGKAKGRLMECDLQITQGTLGSCRFESMLLTQCAHLPCLRSSSGGCHP